MTFEEAYAEWKAGRMSKKTLKKWMRQDSRMRRVVKVEKEEDPDAVWDEMLSNDPDWSMGKLLDH